jgi:hypothetical protein
MIIVNLLAIMFRLPKLYIWYTFYLSCCGNVSVVLPETDPFRVETGRSNRGVPTGGGGV